MDSKTDKNPGGRPKGANSKYHKKFCKMLLDYFENAAKVTHEDIIKKQSTNRTGESVEYARVATDPPLFEEFAQHIGVSSRSLRIWKDKHPEFKEVYEKAHDIQAAIFIKNSLKGLFNPHFAKIVMINMMQWKDSVRDTSTTIKRDVEKLDDRDLTAQIDKKAANITPFKRTANQ